MKRLIGAVIGLSIVGSVLAAQSSFTIVRPADGSKVREKVRVLIPKSSLEEGSYIGVFLDGKFIEAAMPPVEGNYRVYTLDTKGRKIGDGELKLELVKYVSYQDQPRIVDRSSVTVTVGNNMNIKVPAGGLKLRYGFKPGTQLTYRVEQTASVSLLSGSNAAGRAAEFPAGEMSGRVLYAVDTTYGNGDSILRMQYLPQKGKTYAIMLLHGRAEPEKVTEERMAPVYMRVSTTGSPVFGSVPAYFGFSTQGFPGFNNVYSAWPLPVLPSKPVKPGSSWQSRYQMPAFEEGKIYEQSSITKSYPARGEFVAAEWEMGHPCAKIRNSIASGSTSTKGGGDKVEMEEVVWFALDTHQIIKRVRTITQDQKVSDAGGGGGANQGGGGNGGNGGMQRMGPPGLGGGADGQIVPATPGRQTMNAKGAPGTNGGRNGSTGGRTGSNGGGGRVMFVRQRSQQIFILEQ